MVMNWEQKDLCTQPQEIYMEESNFCFLEKSWLHEQPVSIDCKKTMYKTRE
jgi:hypothetical protein